MTKTRHPIAFAPNQAVPLPDLSAAPPNPVSHPRAPVADNWKGTADATWQNAANWSAGAPGANNAVTLSTGTTTITYDSATTTIYSLTSTTDALSIDSGALTVSNAATFGAALTLAGGNLTLNGASTLKTLIGTSGTLSIAASKTATVSGATTLGGLTLVGPGTLVTAGATTVTDTGTSLAMGDGAVWKNTGMVSAAGAVVLGLYNSGNGDGSSAAIVNSGVFNLTGDDAGIVAGSINPGFVATLTNSGTFAKTGGTGVSHVVAALNNTGTLTVATGTVELDNGGTLAGTLSGARHA